MSPVFLSFFRVLRPVALAAWLVVALVLAGCLGSTQGEPRVTLSITRERGGLNYAENHIARGQTTRFTATVDAPVAQYTSQNRDVAILAASGFTFAPNTLSVALDGDGKGSGTFIATVSDSAPLGDASVEGRADLSPYNPTGSKALTVVPRLVSVSLPVGSTVRRGSFVDALLRIDGLGNTAGTMPLVVSSDDGTTVTPGTITATVVKGVATEVPVRISAELAADLGQHSFGVTLDGIAVGRPVFQVESVAGEAPFFFYVDPALMTIGNGFSSTSPITLAFSKLGTFSGNVIVTWTSPSNEITPSPATQNFAVTVLASGGRTTVPRTIRREYLEHTNPSSITFTATDPVSGRSVSSTLVVNEH